MSASQLCVIVGVLWWLRRDPDRAFPTQTEEPRRRTPRGVHMDTRRLLPRLAHHRRHRFRQDALRNHAAAFPSLPERADMGRALHRRQRAVLGNTLENGEALRPRGRPYLAPSSAGWCGQFMAAAPHLQPHIR